MGTGVSIERQLRTARGVQGSDTEESLRIPPTSALQMLLQGPARDDFKRYITEGWSSSAPIEGRTDQMSKSTGLSEGISDKEMKETQLYGIRFLDFWMDARSFQTIPPCMFQVLRAQAIFENVIRTSITILYLPPLSCSWITAKHNISTLLSRA